jgi:hypothetical protein
LLLSHSPESFRGYFFRRALPAARQSFAQSFLFMRSATLSPQPFSADEAAKSVSSGFLELIQSLLPFDDTRIGRSEFGFHPVETVHEQRFGFRKSFLDQ